MSVTVQNIRIRRNHENAGRPLVYGKDREKTLLCRHFYRREVSSGLECGGVRGLIYRWEREEEEELHEGSKQNKY